ncbi:hypothetical protein D9M68_899540 [compost metagenome]
MDSVLAQAGYRRMLKQLHTLRKTHTAQFSDHLDRVQQRIIGLENTRDIGR